MNKTLTALTIAIGSLLVNTTATALFAADAPQTNSTTHTWIWYPGDYEIWLGNRMNNRRTERGSFYPAYMWRTDSHFPIVEFNRQFSVPADETIEIDAEGLYNVILDGTRLFGSPQKIDLKAGNHSLTIQVFNQATPPALYIHGKTFGTDSQWRVTSCDKQRFPEDNYNFYSPNAGHWNFNSIEDKPSQFQLKTELHKAVAEENIQGGRLVDFGKETFGFFKLTGVKGNGTIKVGYGESREEALAWGDGETMDLLEIANGKATDAVTRTVSELKNGIYVHNNTKAFRYIHFITTGDVTFDKAEMLYEYLPVEYRGKFKCNDEELNHIWEVGAYTLHLTTRETFIDGIKRDRWAWSGDALQSYLMNYYLFFDKDTVKRTTWHLRGKDPVYCHLNTILDYTFYWFLGIYDYYMYTGDAEFLTQIYPRMQTMMDFVLGRTNANGMVEGQPGDWVFIDWADGPLDKSGETSFQQILFCRSLETMELCAKLVNNQKDIDKYSKLAKELRDKLIPTFWNADKKALVNNVVNGKQTDSVTRYANMFAIFFNYLTPEQQQQVKQSVLLNDDIMKITTPYMRFYELEAFCAMGEQETVLKEMKDYWGGMIKLGATSFWEKYNPDNNGVEHLTMYGRPFGKSLCHAWGASPLYLLGKYYLGVKPTAPGYKEYTIQPVLGGLEWMEGTIPTPNGDIQIYCGKDKVKVHSDTGVGTLLVKSNGQPKVNIETPVEKKDDTYSITIPAGKEIIVNLK